MTVACPEHDKLRAIQPLSQAVGGFIEWLHERGWQIREPRPPIGRIDDLWMPVRQTTEGLLAEHFEIDLMKLEAEKRAILDELQARRALAGA